MGQLSRVNYICRRIASNQMLLNFGLTRSAGRSSDENEGAASLTSKTRRNASVDLTCAVPHAGLLCLIDTRCGSHRGHYVNSQTQGPGWFYKPGRTVIRTPAN